MEINEAFINSWSREKWLENKRKLADCVWCEGALMKHPMDGKIFLAPELTEYGLVYEIDLEDVVEVISTN